MESIPKQFAPAGAQEISQSLANYAEQGAPAAAFVFLVTAERDALTRQGGKNLALTARKINLFGLRAYSILSITLFEI
jgi:hypothetical protein